MSHVQGLAQKPSFTRQRVIVVGAAGFIGSHIAKLLVENDHNVMMVDDDSFDICAKLEEIVQQMRHYPALEATNICLADAKEVQDMVNSYRPTAIVNAYTSSREERDAGFLPGMVIKEIVVQANLLQALQRFEKMNFVYVSSDDVYGSKYNGDPAIEYDNALQPESQYGVLKKSAENLLLQSARKHTGIQATVFRTSSVYGPGGSPQDSVVNKFLEAVARGTALTVHGDGSTIRDFVYVQDVAEMVVIAVLRGLQGIFNASTGIETTVSQLVSYVKQYGQAHNTEFIEEIHPQIGYKCLYSVYGRDVTGVPITQLSAGMKKTYEDIEARVLENMLLH